MRLLKEGYLDPNVGELKKILRNALEKLNDYPDYAQTKIETNTYFINGDNFLGIKSVGYIDLDDMVKVRDYNPDDDEFIEAVANWYDGEDYNSDAMKAIENIFAKLDPNEKFDNIQDLLNAKATEEDLNKISKITGIKR